MAVKKVALVAVVLSFAAAGFAVGQETRPATKGYIVGEITVTDPATYETFKPKVAALVAKYGGRYLVRGGQARTLEGASPAGQVIVIEFESVAQALAFYNSREGQEVSQIRKRSATSRLFVVEGFSH